MTDSRRAAPRLRPAREADAPFLERMLLEAFNWDRPRFTLAGLLALPRAAHYVGGWPRAGDFGVVAEDARGRELGAAWALRFPAGGPGYGHVAPHIPELTLAVDAGARGGGVGGALLDALIPAAEERGCAGLSLSVEDGNRARGLYEGRGFVPVGRTGEANMMLLRTRTRLRSASPAAGPPPRTGPPGPC
ncbi:GNAT family N-acetyltransferase [Streptomyces sp. NPDC088923]|uniref:GNAT family N-acetyltransferase n=1 Tax=Streptomyces sp. NPDC088923 TaxID=3365913 RepID=UPI00380688B6